MLDRPAKLLPSHLKHTLDLLSRYHEDLTISSIKQTMISILNQIQYAKSYASSRSLYEELNPLLKQLRDDFPEIFEHIIGRVRVVLAILHGTESTEVEKRCSWLDTIIINEV